MQRFSVDSVLLERLDVLAVDADESRKVVNAVCLDFGIELPHLLFHARRSPYTGATEQPRRLLVERHGESEVRQFEVGRRGPVPINGAIRLGRTTTLMTVAHELGHHLVFSLDPPTTPSHGKRWVRRYTEAAASIQAML